MKIARILTLILSVGLICGCSKNTADVNLIPVETLKDGFVFINQKGEIVIKPTQKITNATFFYDGVSLVKIIDESSLTLGNPLTYINTKGEFITSKKYKEATFFREGIAWCVEENGYPTAINKKGETLFVLKNCEKAVLFNEGLAPVSFVENGIEAWGYVNTKGEIVISPIYVACDQFSEGLAPATTDESVGYGYINTKGEYVIQPQFAEAYMFNENGLAIVGIGDSDRKYGVIDKDGKYVISPQYDRIIPDGDMFIVGESGVYGWPRSRA